jgi:hypothetical protein
MNTPSWARPDPLQMQAPNGQKGSPMKQYGRVNQPETIDGLSFSGHALDEMQSDGIPLSEVNRALRVGAITAGRSGETIFYDAVNNVTVIQAPSGRIVTVSFGQLK